MLIMENKCLTMGLYPASLDPNTHKTFRGTCFTKNGTLNGAYTRELTMALEWVIDVFEGKLERVERVDQEARLLLTHTTNDEKPYIMRKNERMDLTELAIHNVNISLLKRIKHILIGQYNTKYGSLSYLVNQAMKLYIEVKKDFVKLVETNKKRDKSFIGDEKGQFTLMDNNIPYEFLELINNRLDNLEQKLETKIESTVQSVFNMSSKVGRKVKNIGGGIVKSHKREEKREKAEEVLDNIKKWNEHGCTVKTYASALVVLKGQGDPRTPLSDLEALENTGLIKKIRNSAHGTSAYEFIENNQYYKYNTEFAKTKFLKAFKTHFNNVDEFRLDELNDLIFSEYGLFDAKSQNRYLNWLIADGYVKRHPVNPRLLLIE